MSTEETDFASWILAALTEPTQTKSRLATETSPCRCPHLEPGYIPDGNKGQVRRPFVNRDIRARRLRATSKAPAQVAQGQSMPQRISESANQPTDVH